MDNYFLFICVLQIFNCIIACVLIRLTYNWHLKLENVENKLKFKIRNQEKFLNTLSSKIADFEILGKIKVVNKGNIFKSVESIPLKQHTKNNKKNT